MKSFREIETFFYFVREYTIYIYKRNVVVKISFKTVSFVQYL